MMAATPTEQAFWADLFGALRPPPQMTVDEWADAYRVIPPEFSAAPGAWRTNRMESMRPVMRAASPSHRCRRVVLVKPVQSGGTEAGVLNVIGHTIDVAPRSMIVTFPTIDLAESFSRERLEPMIAHVPQAARQGGGCFACRGQRRPVKRQTKALSWRVFDPHRRQLERRTLKPSGAVGHH